ncbi:MAG TPA: DHA2 family efflux MFS transporter permease subunit [Mycobacteriales bacterium]|jgi:EmrB/QacA subfamily drug resistance transporter|nr:DHA2 family efflux MFS transporter permease subunit [Mycobacteriales bacterium]
MSSRSRTVWTFVVTSVALFMAQLDNLVVTTALPAIRHHLGASLSSLEWTVNAYTLTFAVLLLTGATLGERFGRRRMLVIGLTVFTFGSAAAALAPSVGWLVVFRAVQGAGAAMVTPLTLTLLSAAVPVERRGMALGIWGGVAGLAIATGPLVGGAVVQGLSWQSIFWLNVPIGLALIPVARFRVVESYGAKQPLDLPGVVLASVGLFGLVLGLVRGNTLGWTSPYVLAALAAGAGLLLGFVGWERRTSTPLLPMRLFASRGFSATNAASVLMFFGMFGSIFLLAQFLQTVQHYSPLSAGLRTLPWTGMPIVVSPLAGILADRIGGRPVVLTGLVLQATGLAWLAAISSPTVPYGDLVPAFVVSGIGMALFFAPVATMVLGTVARSEEGIASGATNALRELGGVFGVAVLAAVFSRHGGYTTGQAFVDGLRPAVAVGAAGVAGAAVAILAVPRRRPAPAAELLEPLPVAA